MSAALRKYPLVGGAVVVAAAVVSALAINYGLRWWRRRRSSESRAASQAGRRPANTFEGACAVARSLEYLSISAQLELYALFKQATEGPCTVRRGCYRG